MNSRFLMSSNDRSFEEILKSNEAQAEVNAKKFIPQNATAYKVEVIGNKAKKVNWEKNGAIYHGYEFTVKVEGSEKSWRVFDNEASRIILAKQKHPNGVLQVQGVGRKFEVS